MVPVSVDVKAQMVSLHDLQDLILYEQVKTIKPFNKWQNVNFVDCPLFLRTVKPNQFFRGKAFSIASMFKYI